MDYTELIQAMKKRELGALDRFQTTFTPLLRYIIAPLLSDERDREECLSNVMLRAWEAIDGYDPSRATFTTWLSALARNTALNRRRSIERRRENGPPDEDIPPPPTVRSRRSSKRKRPRRSGMRWAVWTAGTGSCSCANTITTSPLPRSRPSWG